MNESITILLAESDVDTAVPLLLRLPDHGFRAFHATDGGWVLRLARAARPDLVLLAVDLPRLESLTVCRALTGQVRRTFEVRRTWNAEHPAITSGPPEVRRTFEVRRTWNPAHEQEPVRGLELGADACLVKPFRLPPGPSTGSAGLQNDASTPCLPPSTPSVIRFPPCWWPASSGPATSVPCPNLQSPVSSPIPNLSNLALDTCAH